MTDTQPNPYIDESGTHYGTCNSCGEEGDLYGECQNPDCDGGGEMVPYDDDPSEEL